MSDKWLLQGFRFDGAFRSSRRSIVLSAVLVLACGCGVFDDAIRGEDVGPDAEEMAKDPLLNIEIDDAEAGEVATRTGKEGGLIPAGANPESRASRIWTVDRADALDQMVAAVATAEDLEVTFHSLRCSEGSVGSDLTYTGSKDVSIGDESVVANVRIALNLGPQEAEPSRADLSISLRSEGAAGPTERSGRSSEPVTADCPDELVDAVGRPGEVDG